MEFLSSVSKLSETLHYLPGYKMLPDMWNPSLNLNLNLSQNQCTHLRKRRS